MNVALYYPWVYLKGGAERTLLELVTRSRHDWTIYTNHFHADGTFPQFADLRVVERSTVPVQRDLVSVARAAATIGLQRLDLSGHDRAVVVSEGLGNLMAGRTGVPTTCICLTPLKVAYDRVTTDQFFKGNRRLPYKAAFGAFRAVDRRTWRSYDRIFCISETVRDRLMDHRLTDLNHTEVIYPGVDHELFHPGPADDDFFLLPGRIMWQKHVELALETWQLFKPHPSDNAYRLVIAGMVDAKSRSYLAALRQQAAWRHDVEFISTPTDSQLVSLYQRCRAVLFTAPNEDLGLVPLEAMACGKGVIATQRGGPSETIIDGLTGLLAAHTPRAFAAAMATIAAMDGGGRQLMAERARARALEFNWDRFVSRIDDHLDGASRPRPRPLVLAGGTR